MTVGELKAMLAHLPDDFGVTLKVTTSDEDPGIAGGNIRIGYLMGVSSAFYESSRWGTVVLGDRPIERKRPQISAAQGIVKR